MTKKQNWQSGQKVTRQDLNRASSTKEEAIQDRQIDNFTGGVISDLLNGMTFQVGTTATSLTVRTGIAYDGNGERIVVSDETTTYDATNPNDTTPDGLGGTSPTPQSTGSKDIPVASGSVSLIYIQYLLTLDPLVFSVHKVTGQKLFTKADDGFEIRVVDVGAVDPTTVDITANQPGTGGPWIFLGWVDFRAGGTISASMFNTSSRPRYEIRSNRVQTKTPQTDLSDRTPEASYGFNTVVNFSQHVKAVGGGTPTATNPHGLTLSDIGFAGKSVETHERFLHSSGIVNGDPTPNIGNSLNLKVNPKCPDLDELVIFGLTSTQFLIVRDTTLSSADLFGTAGTKILSFVGQSTGTYYIWANTTTRTVEFGSIAPLTSETNKFLLWTIDFNTTKGATTISGDHFVTSPGGPCAGTSNFTNLTDNRLFGNLGSNNLQVDVGTDTFTADHNVEVTKNLTVGQDVDASAGTVTANEVDTQTLTFGDSSQQTSAAHFIYMAVFESSSTSGTLNCSVNLSTGAVSNGTVTFLGGNTFPAGIAALGFGALATASQADNSSQDMNWSPVVSIIADTSSTVNITYTNAGSAGHSGSGVYMFVGVVNP